MLEILKQLVASFSDDDGLPSETFAATYNLLVKYMGEEIAQAFSDLVRAQDGRFYIRPSPEAAVLLVFGENPRLKETVWCTFGQAGTVLSIHREKPIEPPPFVREVVEFDLH